MLAELLCLNKIIIHDLCYLKFSHRYLQEVGYTDTILDVRSSRVRSILGLSVADASAPDHPQPNGISSKSRGDEFAVIEEHARSPKRTDSTSSRKLSNEESDGVISITPGKR